MLTLTKDTLHLTLPYPPSINTYWRRRGNRYFIAKRGIEFRKAVIGIVEQKSAAKQMSKRLKLEIIATMPDRRIRDLDNIGKAVCDALSHSKVIEDDRCIDDLRIVRAGIEKNNGRIDIYLVEMLNKN